RKDVEAALARAAELRDQGRWKEARLSLEQARRRLAEGGSDELRQQWERASADLDLVDRLDAICLKKATVVGGKFDLAAADRDDADLLARAGFAREGDDPAEVARRVADSAIKAQLVAALDDWAASTADEDRRAWLLACSRRADPDERRDKLRDPQAWRDQAA